MEAAKKEIKEIIDLLDNAGVEDVETLGLALKDITRIATDNNLQAINDRIGMFVSRRKYESQSFVWMLCEVRNLCVEL